ncbi:hypothetical protein E2P81_ATG09338 [Venturia nashicola]|uniref:Uncharacterized protein n=1 Tax=Venturia nashicola TaxID=86259 RepID=A0A4Z1NLK3_9PEZI|nr:hypothetical protein E6O75_ATG09545 [Venturia nashicola]TLD25681.1 hypothetical protein E2P81_ATG09338 [Venturia nashicola]
MMNGPVNGRLLSLVISNWIVMHGTALMPHHIVIDQIWRRTLFSNEHETPRRSWLKPTLYSATMSRFLSTIDKSSKAKLSSCCEVVLQVGVTLFVVLQVVAAAGSSHLSSQANEKEVVGI